VHARPFWSGERLGRRGDHRLKPCSSAFNLSGGQVAGGSPSFHRLREPLLGQHFARTSRARGGCYYDPWAVNGEARSLGTRLARTWPGVPFAS
jgi:hypothetical protein